MMINNNTEELTRLEEKLKRKEEKLKETQKELTDAFSDVEFFRGLVGGFGSLFALYLLREQKC